MCIYGPKTVCVLYLDEDRVHWFCFLFMLKNQKLWKEFFFFFFLLNKRYRVQDYKLLKFYGDDY